MSTAESHGFGPMMDWDEEEEEEEDLATHIEVRTLTPMAGLGGVRVVAVAADNQRHYTLALDATGEVYSWGGNNAAHTGALGHCDEQPRLVPTRVEALSGQGVCGLCASFDCSLAWTEAGSLFSWGQFFNYSPRPPPDCTSEVFSAYMDSLFGKRLSPTQVPELQGNSVRCAAAGHLLTLAVLHDGQLFSWGHKSSYHGHGDVRGDVGVPTQVRPCLT
jgi:alpha-tubulin suppressor-like RCC1 family protein